MTDSPHPSLDDLADLHEGLLSGERSTQLHEHVQQCDDCSQAMAALDEVQAVLASEPAPAMPTAVADSLEEALARVSLERLHGVTSLTGRRESGERAEAAGARRNRWLRVAGAAAAIVVVGYGAVTAVQHLPGSGDSNESAARVPPGDAQQFTGGGAGFGVEKAPQVTTKSLVRYGTALAGSSEAPQFHTPATNALTPTATPARPSAVCTPDLPSRHVVFSVIRWKGAPATVAVDSSTRRITVYACGRPLTRLYSTSY